MEDNGTGGSGDTESPAQATTENKLQSHRSRRVGPEDLGLFKQSDRNGHCPKRPAVEKARYSNARMVFNKK